MGIIPSRNLEDQRREKNGIVYFDRGTLTGRNGRRYDRFAIQTHFVEVGENQADLVRKYVLPLAERGDLLSFGAKVMAMCTRNVKTKDEVHPGFWAIIISAISFQLIQTSPSPRKISSFLVDSRTFM